MQSHCINRAITPLFAPLKLCSKRVSFSGCPQRRTTRHPLSGFPSRGFATPGSSLYSRLFLNPNSIKNSRSPTGPSMKVAIIGITIQPWAIPSAFALTRIQQPTKKSKAR